MDLRQDGCIGDCLSMFGLVISLVLPTIHRLGTTVAKMKTIRMDL